MPARYLERLETLDRLIRIKGTGTPEQLSHRLGLSKRRLYEYILLMKELGADIKYCKFRQSYYYKEEGKFIFKFIIEHE
jgi:predicted DNA-binding transcriptional regulator YafY